MSVPPPTSTHQPQHGNVADFYAGKSIFITGGSGFIGKVFIEKFIRSCPNIKHLYILLRPKKDKSPQARLEQMFKLELFDRMRAEQPDFMSKLSCIDGDLEKAHLGLSEESKTILVENCDVIIHSAATVRFDEPLPIAVSLNIRAVRDLLTLSDQMKHLTLFVHISTAYSNCDRREIDETIYPLIHSVNADKVIDMVSWLPNNVVDILSPHLTEPKPNTYTFTKHIAENMVHSHVHNKTVPYRVCIIRPSIVGAMWQDPLPGWIDNFNGACGVFVSAGKGVLRNFVSKPGIPANIIPVDSVTNLSIAAGWYTCKVQKDPKEVSIYHITADPENICEWGSMERIVMNYWEKMPLECCFRRPHCYIIDSERMYRIMSLIRHTLPGYLFDGLCILIGQRPHMVKTYSKIEKMVSSLQFFSTNKWVWHRRNMFRLRDSLSAKDRQVWQFDPSTKNWQEYLENFCLGAKKFLLREDETRLDGARSHLRKLRNIRYAFNAVLALLAFRLLVANSQIGKQMWQLILSMVFRFVRFFKLSSSNGQKMVTVAVPRTSVL